MYIISIILYVIILCSIYVVYVLYVVLLYITEHRAQHEGHTVACSTGLVKSGGVPVVWGQLGSDRVKNKTNIKNALRA
jgi:hypothetical protein